MHGLAVAILMGFGPSFPLSVVSVFEMNASWKTFNKSRKDKIVPISKCPSAKSIVMWSIPIAAHQVTGMTDRIDKCFSTENAQNTRPSKERHNHITLLPKMGLPSTDLYILVF